MDERKTLPLVTNVTPVSPENLPNYNVREVEEEGQLETATTTYRITLKFQTAAGKDVTMSFSPAKSTATSNDVDSLMDAIITNGAIFVDVPATKVSAVLVQTTTTPYTITA